jgi:hypothetical protein
MQVIKEIRENGFARIEGELGIKVKRAGGYVLLDYCQINSPKLDPIVKECRGLILDEETLEVACRSFDRFFNYGEGDAQNLDFKGCKVVEKVDGSLIRVWYDHKQGMWQVSTRGTIFADSAVMGNDFTFRELFVRVFCEDREIEVSEESFQKHMDRVFWDWETVIFELATPFNRVVTRYEFETIKLLAIRDNRTGFYYSNETTFQSPEEYSIGSFEECIKASQELGGLKEGFVVIDQNRVPVCKIKSPAYVAVHHIRGEGLNPKRISQLVWSGEADEYLTYFPEDLHVIEPYMTKRIEVEAAIAQLWLATMNIEGQKEFALEVKDTPYAGVLFNSRKGFLLGDGVAMTNDKIKQGWLGL